MSLSARAAAAPPSNNRMTSATRFMIDLHLSQSTVRLSVGRDEEAVQAGSITNWKREATIAASRPRFGQHLARRHQAFGSRRNPAPVVAGAIEAAEGASFDAKCIRRLQVHGAVKRVTALMAVDIAGPLRLVLVVQILFVQVFGLHVDQHRLAAVIGR